MGKELATVVTGPHKPGMYVFTPFRLGPTSGETGRRLEVLAKPL